MKNIYQELDEKLKDYIVSERDSENNMEPQTKTEATKISLLGNINEFATLSM